MKRISISIVILCTCLAAVAWAQQQAVMPHMGRHVPPKLSATTKSSVSAHATQAHHVRVYDLGHYPDGTWAEPRGINGFGVVVGIGDILGGYTRQIGVPLFGPQAGQWFDLGSFGGEDTTGWIAEGGGVTDTGMIVGSAGTEEGYTHAFAWTPEVGAKVDLGTLPSDPGSVAIAVNKIGTLVVGVSYNDLQATAVVWTPEVVWKQGQPTTTWEIQKLPTGGLEQPGKVFEGVTLDWWGGWAVNDSGQIVGDAWSDNYDEIAVIWNPRPGGKGWKIMQLPHHPDDRSAPNYRYTEALDINESGEIVGDLGWENWPTAIPALWKTESPRGKTWKLTVLPTLSGLLQGWNVAWGINDLGDIVGVSNDADGNWFAARWSTRKTNFVRVLGFPGTWSEAFKVNNNRIAAGAYGSDSIQEDVAAVQFH
jgi:probable HAF family extracellular repeat protein